MPQGSATSTGGESADLLDMGAASGEGTVDKGLDDLAARLAALGSRPAEEAEPPQPSPPVAAQQPQPSATTPVLPPMEPHPTFGRMINLYSHAANVLSHNVRSRVGAGPHSVQFVRCIHHRVTAAQRLDIRDGHPVVIDNGSHMLRAGFAGEYHPRSIFHNIVGRPSQQEVLDSDAHQSVYVGEGAHQRRPILNITSPVNQGIVVDWDDMSRVLDHTFSNELRVPSSAHPIVLTEPQYNSGRCRAAAAQVLFERFGVPAIWFGPQPSLALYGAGRTTGVLLECGLNMCQVIPICRGQTLTYAASVAKTGGLCLSEYLGKIMRDTGHAFVSGSERAILDRMREQLCYTAADFDAELVNAALSPDLDRAYLLPDGRSVGLASERFRCTEPLFAPSMVGQEGGGIAHMVLQAVSKCDPDVREELLNNIVLSGALTMTTSLPERLATEFQKTGLRFSISAPRDRDLRTWHGASMLASGAAFQGMQITRQTYQERGRHMFLT